MMPIDLTDLPTQNSLRKIDLPLKTGNLPLLLVSIRDEMEARVALRAGIEMLDVKDPSAGPLGAAPPEVLRKIADTIAPSSNIHFSAALGELQSLSSGISHFELPPTLDFVKLGLSACCSVPDWKERFRQAKDQLRSSSGRRSPGWVAVVYADHTECGAPAPADVIDFAIQAECVGLLVDTFTKTGRSTFDFLAAPDLSPLRRACRENGLFFALAGSIKAEHLPAARNLEPDIIAVRGAVCKGENRTEGIDFDAIQLFQRALRHSWSGRC